MLTVGLIKGEEESQKYDGKRMDREEFVRFLDWVKNVSLVVDGLAYRSMLRRDEYTAHA